MPNEAKQPTTKAQPHADASRKVLKCGIIMPISAIDGTTAEHWAEVKSIITEAIDSIEYPKFTTSLVSDADEVGVIQKRIIQNVYNSEIIVCDVSGKNPNVMFELGLRLAFDKPTVIIKDDMTDYSFDTGVIEHIGYPRDLRFAKIVNFKKKLSEKVSNTYAASLKDPNHSPFLGSFGKFQVAEISQTTVSTDKLILERLDEIYQDVEILKRRDRDAIHPRPIPGQKFTLPGEHNLIMLKAFIHVLDESTTPLLGIEQSRLLSDVIPRVQQALQEKYNFGATSENIKTVLLPLLMDFQREGLKNRLLSS